MDRINDWCVSLMKNKKSYGRKHLLNDIDSSKTQCGIDIKSDWYVFKSHMAFATWIGFGCARCQQIRGAVMEDDAAEQRRAA